MRDAEMKTQTRAIVITPGVLRSMPLPLPDEGGDKEERGRALVIGGGRETPGAVILAGTAALRAGAGKLQIATVACVASLVASSIPEARVFALAETKSSKLSKSAFSILEGHIGKAQCVCIGPGMIEDGAVVRFAEEVLRLCKNVPVVLDAGAAACLRGGLKPLRVAAKPERMQGAAKLKRLGGAAKLMRSFGGRAVITPNGEELAGIYGVGKEEITDAPLEASLRAARDFGAVVALKGRETFIASPGGEVYVNRAGSVGLATSGSGDVLAGIIAGLVARGAEPLGAAVWGVHLHALAGERLSARVGPLGFLARELLAEVPSLMSELSCGERPRVVLE